MVQATDKYRLTDTGFVDFEQWLPLVQQFYPKHRLQKISGAIDILMKIGIDEPSRHQGSCFNYGVEMAAVLFDLEADEEALAAALLFELYSHQKISSEVIAEASGINVVRILDGAAGTTAKTRVLVESSNGEERWSTIGVSSNILAASYQAVVEGIEYGLLLQSSAKTQIIASKVNNLS